MFRRIRSMMSWWRILLCLLLSCTLGWFLFLNAIELALPTSSTTELKELVREKVSNDAYQVNASWLRKNAFGLWEMRLKGSGIELGRANGVLAQELMSYQEQVFIGRIKEMIPSPMILSSLKYFIAWFNRNMDQHVPTEYLQEIYGVSLYASPKFDVIGPAYQRHLNYHGAHDIGHAMQNMNLVACSGLALWGNHSKNQSLMLARNFDFHVNEDFARHKILTFVEPDHGHRFVSVSFAGMIGVLSGMNDQGLTVTLNAAKSEIPLEAAMPVSLLARQILQYSKNIDEAVAFAKQAKTFVAESFLIGSKQDGRAVIIEKSVLETRVVESQDQRLIQTNHFQSEGFQNRPLTRNNIKESASLGRWQRLEELLNHKETFEPEDLVGILRDDRGAEDQDIGWGNELALNQYIAHHAVVFLPESLELWVSTAPYQLGPFLKYSLLEAFEFEDCPKVDWHEVGMGPAPEEQLDRSKKLMKYRQLRQSWLHQEMALKQVTPEEMDEFITLNPNYYETHYWKGKWYEQRGELKRAKKSLEKALTMAIPRKVEKDLVIQAFAHLTE